METIKKKGGRKSSRDIRIEAELTDAKNELETMILNNVQLEARIESKKEAIGLLEKLLKD